MKWKNPTQNSIDPRKYPLSAATTITFDQVLLIQFSFCISSIRICVIKKVWPLKIRWTINIVRTGGTEALRPNFSWYKLRKCWDITWERATRKRKRNGKVVSIKLGKSLLYHIAMSQPVQQLLAEIRIEFWKNQIHYVDKVEDFIGRISHFEVANGKICQNRLSISKFSRQEVAALVQTLLKVDEKIVYHLMRLSSMCIQFSVHISRQIPYIREWRFFQPNQIGHRFQHFMDICHRVSGVSSLVSINLIVFTNRVELLHVCTKMDKTSHEIDESHLVSLHLFYSVLFFF